MEILARYLMRKKDFLNFINQAKTKKWVSPRTKKAKPKPLLISDKEDESDEENDEENEKEKEVSEGK